MCAFGLRAVSEIVSKIYKFWIQIETLECVPSCSFFSLSHPDNFRMKTAERHFASTALLILCCIEHYALVRIVQAYLLLFSLLYSQ